MIALPPAYCFNSIVLHSNCALKATTIVLIDISTAPTAGESKMPSEQI